MINLIYVCASSFVGWVQLNRISQWMNFIYIFSKEKKKKKKSLIITVGDGDDLKMGARLSRHDPLAWELNAICSDNLWSSTFIILYDNDMHVACVGVFCVCVVIATTPQTVCDVRLALFACHCWRLHFYQVVKWIATHAHTTATTVATTPKTVNAFHATDGPLPFCTRHPKCNRSAIGSRHHSSFLNDRWRSAAAAKWPNV